MNYKVLKKKINDIVVEQGGAAKEIERSQISSTFIAKSPAEVEFFRYVFIFSLLYMMFEP